MDERVRELERLGVIERSDEVKVTMPTFVVEGARLRKVLDARYLNRAVRTHKFKMESLKTLLQHVRANDYGATLDISKAYNALRLHRRSRPYLGFRHRGTTYRYSRMPFGLSSAPRTFTKVMRPVLQHLRQQGMRAFIYLDDICLLHQEKETLEQQLDQVAQLLTKLGFVVHPKKRTKPLRRFKYLGMVVDTTQMTVEPQAAKLGEMRRDARRLLRRGQATPRQLAAFLGKATFCLGGMRSGHHRKAPLLRLLRRKLRQPNGWDAKASALCGEARQCLGWWVHHANHLLGKLFRPNTAPSVRILSDAGPEGWGAVVRQKGAATQRLSGTWTEEEAEEHQNVKEAMALLQALPAVQSRLPTRRVHWVTDSRVLFYTVRKGHSRSDRLSRAVERIRERLSPALHLHVQHIRSEEMRRADHLSRRVVDRHGWALQREHFEAIGDRRAVVPAADRPVRHAHQRQAEQVRQQEFGPGRGEQRVGGGQLDARLRLSAAHAPLQTIAGVGGAHPTTDGGGGTGVASAAVVGAAGDGGARTSGAATGSGVRTRLEDVRDFLALEIRRTLAMREREARQRAAIFVGSKQASTVRSYYSAVRHYVQWAQGAERSAYDGDTPTAYVSERTRGGYASVQHLWSALSWLFEAVNRPMTNDMRGALTQYALRNNTRSRQQKVLDVDQVLDYFRRHPEWGGSANAAEVRRKAIVLLTVSLGARGADLATIRRDGIKYTDYGMEVSFGVRKQDRGVRHQWQAKKVYAVADQSVCTVTVVKRWMQLSSGLGLPQLFTSLPAYRGRKRGLKADTINGERTRFLRDQMGWRSATSHQLKAAVITWCMNNGVDDERARRRLDATSPAVIHRHYDRADAGDPTSEILRAAAGGRSAVEQQQH